MRPLQRRYIYTDTAEEIISWAKDQIKRELLDNPPNNKPNFPYYLEQYIKSHK